MKYLFETISVMIVIWSAISTAYCNDCIPDDVHRLQDDLKTGCQIANCVSDSISRGILPEPRLLVSTLGIQNCLAAADSSIMDRFPSAKALILQKDRGFEALLAMASEAMWDGNIQKLEVLIIVSVEAVGIDSAFEILSEKLRGSYKTRTYSIVLMQAIEKINKGEINYSVYPMAMSHDLERLRKPFYGKRKTFLENARDIWAEKDSPGSVNKANHQKQPGLKPKPESPEPKDSISLIPLLTGFGVVLGIILIVVLIRRRKGQK